MSLSLVFLVNSLLLGVGLAIDAFSVSIANGLMEPDMSRGRRRCMAGTFGAFQSLMPLLGWLFVGAAAARFEMFQKAVPWIALALLLYIGGKMLIESIRQIRQKGDGPQMQEEAAGQEDGSRLGPGALLMQGIATSIDALSVGFAISDYQAAEAVLCALIIGAVTYAICMLGLRIGKTAGRKITDKAGILGGCILIFIGIEIFIRGVL